jgi:hypothetical protein
MQTYIHRYTHTYINTNTYIQLQWKTLLAALNYKIGVISIAPLKNASALIENIRCIFILFIIVKSFIVPATVNGSLFFLLNR